MKQADVLIDDLFKKMSISNPKMDISEWLIAYDFLSSMLTETLVIFDFVQKEIRYMSNNNLILYDSVQEPPKEINYDFFKQGIHQEDISFWGDIHDIILNSLDNDELVVDQINYFSFLLRVKIMLSYSGLCDYAMVYVKLKPQWLNEQLRYGICLLSASVIRKQSNRLCVHYKNLDYLDYSFKTKKWKHYQFDPLSKRQKEMLLWAQHGLSLKETAVKMNVSDKTIESMRCRLFEKLGVNTIEQAIQYASNRRLISHFPII